MSDGPIQPAEVPTAEVDPGAVKATVPLVGDAALTGMGVEHPGSDKTTEDSDETTKDPGKNSPVEWVGNYGKIKPADGTTETDALLAEKYASTATTPDDKNSTLKTSDDGTRIVLGPQKYDSNFPTPRNPQFALSPRKRAREIGQLTPEEVAFAKLYAEKSDPGNKNSQIAPPETPIESIEPEPGLTDPKNSSVSGVDGLLKVDPVFAEQVTTETAIRPNIPEAPQAPSV